MNGAGERITAAIRSDVFGHMQRLPLAYHDRQSIGELASRLSVDTDRIEDALVDLFSTLLHQMDPCHPSHLFLKSGFAE